MTSPIKNLQEELAKDLVKFEESNLTEEQLKLIEQTYYEIYLKLHKIDEE